MLPGDRVLHRRRNRAALHDHDPRRRRRIPLQRCWDWQGIIVSLAVFFANIKPAQRFNIFNNQSENSKN